MTPYDKGTYLTIGVDVGAHGDLAGGRLLQVARLLQLVEQLLLERLPRAEAVVRHPGHDVLVAHSHMMSAKIGSPKAKETT